MAADRSTPADDRTEWEGYSDYGAISRSVSKSISNAIEHYAWLDAVHRDGVKTKDGAIATARSTVLAAAIRLFVEMREERANGNDQYDEILKRWTGGEIGGGDLPTLGEHWDGTDSPPGENGGQFSESAASFSGFSDQYPEAAKDDSQSGYLRAFQTVELDDSVPSWVLQFVVDIRTAGWKLGYLQAGRRSKKDPEDPVQAEAEHMLRGG